MNAIQDRVTTILTSKFGVKPEELQGDVVLADLRFDSLALLELALTFSEEFDIFVAHDELSIDHTVIDTVSLVEAKGVSA
ncbi:phosphopantetheine-binding protein [Streptomyces tateyamensis]|uniref:Phosphopantetheine-binding protein n=1 Tax=Streptomyces tateyamensis TaxID=565073 RepID=A0A2V4NAA8_9ACTN|nr:phosphopantetheine-binding protein [Streptomyces tateyamensis]PYC72361.1 phosphopantetheine-binding protein [Streptomyces tateyamensis]